MAGIQTQLKDIKRHTRKLHGCVQGFKEEVTISSILYAVEEAERFFKEKERGTKS